MSTRPQSQRQERGFMGTPGKCLLYQLSKIIVTLDPLSMRALQTSSLTLMACINDGPTRPSRRTVLFSGTSTLFVLATHCSSATGFGFFVGVRGTSHQACELSNYFLGVLRCSASGSYVTIFSTPLTEIFIIVLGR